MRGKAKLAGFWGLGNWGKQGSKTHAAQLRKKGYKGVFIKVIKGKGYSVFYKKKGRGSHYFDWQNKKKKKTRPVKKMIKRLVKWRSR